jgi:hypothetical protein
MIEQSLWKHLRFILQLEFPADRCRWAPPRFCPVTSLPTWRRHSCLLAPRLFPARENCAGRDKLKHVLLCSHRSFTPTTAGGSADFRQPRQGVSELRPARRRRSCLPNRAAISRARPLASLANS